MCNTATVNTIIEHIAEMIKQNKVFTAYDVTLAVRETTDDNVRHSDVQDIITSEYNNGGMTNYLRDYCTLNIANSPKAFVYFHSSMSPSNHPLISGGSVSIGGDGSTNNGSGSTVVDLDDDEFQMTAEGRFNIPKKMLSQITANAGSYDILISGSLKCATPNKDGRVRISLRSLGILDSKVKITVDIMKNTINIETV